MPAQKNDLSFKEMEVDLKQLKHPLTWYHHEVMPGEIDSFQVVNYSRYYEWLSAALLKFFENQGLDATGKFENGTKEMRVARVKTAYISSARIGEQVDVIIHRLTLKQRHMVIYYRVKCKHRDRKSVV